VIVVICVETSQDPLDSYPLHYNCVEYKYIIESFYLFIICFVGSIVPDSYVPGGVISPASFLQPELPAQTDQNLTTLDTHRNTFVSFQGSGNRNLPANHIGARRQHDKSAEIQFLQNVHFPERHQSQAVSQGAVCLRNKFPMFPVIQVATRAKFSSNLMLIASYLFCSF
jgi:hypothetical protein